LKSLYHIPDVLIGVGLELAGTHALSIRRWTHVVAPHSANG
jgi:hypothetical protein